MSYSTAEIAKQTARDLRRRQTTTEGKLWSVLRNRQLLGRKFLRQHPTFFKYQSKKRYFVADLYCHEKKLIVEIDGKIHDFQKEYDELRTYIINSLGIQVIRFKNRKSRTVLKLCCIS
jgi:very-short-patch-repair endonuclease